LWAFIYRTRFGVVLRATSQNMRMASALGVDVNRVYIEAFVIGCFMAGLGGAIIVPSQSAVLGMGVDALVLAFIVVVIGGLGSVVVTALFGFVCVRYTRIFFGILTLALSQVLWSLAFKFFWVTGGTDGLRVPTPMLLGVASAKGDKIEFLSHGYYWYVLAIFFACVALMWVIVNSPFGKALQAIRDNEVR